MNQWTKAKAYFDLRNHSQNYPPITVIIAAVLGLAAIVIFCSTSRGATTEPTTELSIASDQPNQDADQDDGSKDDGSKDDGPKYFEGKVDVVSSYFYRGYNTIDSGLILQPQLTLYLPTVSYNDFSFTPYVSTWNNIISDTHYDSSGMKHFNETDLIGGVSTEWKRLTLDLSYDLQSYPSGFAGQVQEFGAVLTFDDSKLIHVFPVGLQPHISYYYQFEDGLGGQNSYGEFGIKPVFQINEKLSIAVPALIGVSFDNFYLTDSGHNQFLGYTDIGVLATYKLNKHLDIHAGLDYLYLMADSAVDANSGDRNVFFATVGLGFSY